MMPQYDDAASTCSSQVSRCAALVLLSRVLATRLIAKGGRSELVGTVSRIGGGCHGCRSRQLTKAAAAGVRELADDGCTEPLLGQRQHCEQGRRAKHSPTALGIAVYAAGRGIVHCVEDSSQV